MIHALSVALAVQAAGGLTPGPADLHVLDFAGASILYGGDTVGRRITDPPDACKDAEAFMVANHDAGRVSLKASVIIAPRGRVAGCTDRRGDDDVEIVIRAKGTVEVAYRGSGAGC